MALNANALTSLDMAKEFLKIPLAQTAMNSIVELCINSASQDLETETDRFLKKRTSLVEYRGGYGDPFLVPKQYPIISVSEIRVDSSCIFGSDTIVPSSEYTIADEEMTIYRIGSYWERGLKNIKITYTCGFDPVPSDLENACLWLVAWYYKIRNSEDIGRTTKSKEGESTSYSQSMPQNVKDIIKRYKRTEFNHG
jgi:hypothetical protein